MSLLELFCDIDDFWQRFEPQWQQGLLESRQQRQRQGRMSMSELMTLVVHFHQKRFRDFKTYYTEYVQVYLRREFPALVSYSRFVQWMPRILVALCAYLRHCYGTCTGLSFVDSSALAVCHNRRIHQHRVFAGIAMRGHTSVDWFFGFKLHLVINDRGEILSCCVTPGNVDERRPVPKLAQRLFGKLFGDKGYLSRPLAHQLMEDYAVQLITKLRANMSPQLMDEFDQFCLRKRAILESVYDQLKNISQIEHSRHRSLTGLMVNLLAGLLAYCHQPKKPSLNLQFLSALVPA
ncbi:MAG: IS982 family transposase [Anaerolineae bacterium]|nr:IS982 family transposase [Anaerolineae bacterium]